MEEGKLSRLEEEIDRIAETLQKRYRPDNLDAGHSETFDYAVRGMVEDILTAHHDGRNTTEAISGATGRFEAELDAGEIPLSGRFTAKSIAEQVAAAILNSDRLR